MRKHDHIVDLALARGATSTWGRLPAAGAISMEDDLSAERGWLVILEGLGATGFPDTVRELALASTDEGFVSKPMSLIQLLSQIRLMDRPITVYPVLSGA